MRIKLLSENEINKKYPSSNRGSVLLPSDETIWLPCEALGINWMLGGGIPLGKILEIFGYESTGKSLLAMGFAKCCHKLGGVVLWADAESSFDPKWAEENGLDLSRTVVFESNEIESTSDWSRDMVALHRSRLVNNQPILLVIDSLAALECEANINSDDREGKAQMGNRAKAIYQFLRKRSYFFKTMGVAVIFINQVRKKLGASMFENADTTPGGDAPKFYASQRLSLVAGKQIKGIVNRNGFKEKSDGIKFGRTIYVGIAKNKVAPPRSNIKTQVHFRPEAQGYIGYSRYHSLPDILLEEDIITKKGSRYYYGEHMICNGEDAFLKFIAENPKRRKLLIDKSTINTLSKTRAKMDGLTKNLFPITLKVNNDDDDDDEE